MCSFFCHVSQRKTKSLSDIKCRKSSSLIHVFRPSTFQDNMLRESHFSLHPYLLERVYNALFIYSLSLTRTAFLPSFRACIMTGINSFRRSRISWGYCSETLKSVPFRFAFLSECLTIFLESLSRNLTTMGLILSDLYLPIRCDRSIRMLAFVS